MEILSETPEWVCVDKKPGVSTEAVLQQFKRDRRGSKFSCIYALDADVNGFLLLAKTLDARDCLKNAYGSDQLTFTFACVGKRHTVGPKDWTCDLSIAWDACKQRSYPNKNGKKTFTNFRIQGEYGPYLSVLATTKFLRPQQIQTHSHFTFFDILGDDLWIPCPHWVYLEDLKSSVKKSTNSPISTGLHLALIRLVFNFMGTQVVLEKPEPKQWLVLGKVLERYVR